MTLKWLLLSLPIIAGMLNALQSGINGTLGKKIGVFEASLVNFIVGTLVLILVTVLFGKGDFPSVFSVPKWQWLGGVLGAIYVLFVVIMVPKIGVAPVVICIITGQLVMSSMIDHFGLFGTKVPFDWNRLVGILFMALAIYFFYRKGLA
jgi:transporter family-2 protein